MFAFFIGLSLICAGTLMYEVVLTRMLSVLCWYYLAFVSISIAMFGMTAGALAVQLRPDWFPGREMTTRLAQAAFAMAVSMPVMLILMLAVPLDISFALQTLFSFLLVSVIIAVPFFFSGVAVCLSLTKTAFPIGRVYFADLSGAAAGCVAAILLLKTIDAPSAVFVISSLLFLSAAAYATYAEDRRLRRRSYMGAAALLIIAGLNASTLHGIQPIWSKGQIDRRVNLEAEVWTPISKVRAQKPGIGAPQMWGPSPLMPKLSMEHIMLDIDNDAGTPMARFRGDLKPFDYLRYDVTSIGAQLRVGGTAAIIGVGGGRDVLNCAVNGFRRIVGIEINSAIVDLDTRRLEWFSGFSKIPGFELHEDEGRSFLARSNERFDIIQASLVDTWAATAAGALALSENALYTVDGWQIFYARLKPGGIVTFSRWYNSSYFPGETYRLFSVAWATLLRQGVRDPSRNIAVVASGPVATLLASNEALSQADLGKIRAIADQMQFEILFLPGQKTPVPELQAISSDHTLDAMANLGDIGGYDYSPVFDSSPYFFSTMRLRNIPRFVTAGAGVGNLRALACVFAFMLAAVVLVIATILLPVKRWIGRRSESVPPLPGSILYFIAIGLGFMVVEMAFMQQLSIFLGHPVYSFVVALAGLILSTGFGSLVSDRLGLGSSGTARLPALAATLIIVAYSVAVLPAIHHFTPEVLWQRVAVSLVLVLPCGFLMGFCFPVGLRWMTRLQQGANLPWMWALNGAAATLGSFVALLVSIETSITTCVLTGAACYLVAAIALPARGVLAVAPQSEPGLQ